MTTEPPRLRPYTHGGKAYYEELRAILAEIGPALKADAEAMRDDAGKLTVRALCQLALKYTLNVKATCEALEDMRILPTGTYDGLKDRGFKPMAMLRQVAAEDEAFI